MEDAEANPQSSEIPELEGTFTIQGKQCSVSLAGQTIKWQVGNGKKKDETVVPIGHIISVSANNDASDSGELSLVYIKRKKKFDLVRDKKVFHGSQDLCSKLVKVIQDKISQIQQRPRSCLVLVNPISGFKKGEREYREKVAPLFQEANIKTHVIVTESADHVKEVLKTFDLSSIDSIVVVGGDGIYHLLVNALLRRLADDAGLDLNDSNVDLPDVPLKIGIIPCGTGNGIAMTCYRSRDTVTAAAAIIIGDTQASNIQGVWSASKFVVFTVMMHAAGIFLDLIYETEARRNLGVFRYFLVMSKFAFKSSVPSIKATVEYKPPISMSEETTQSPPPPDSIDGQATSEGDWKTWTGRYVSLFTSTFDMYGYRGSRNPACLNQARFITMKDWSRMSYLKFVHSMMSYDPVILRNPNYEHATFTEYKVKVDNWEELERSGTMINVDGEVVRLNNPEFHVKVYPKKLKLYSTQTVEDLLDL